MTRKGAKKRPFYRIVVTEQDSKRDGRFVEIVGHYDPIAQDKKIVLKRDRYDYWVGLGAQPSDTVRRCVRQVTAAEKATAAS